MRKPFVFTRSAVSQLLEAAALGPAARADLVRAAVEELRAAPEPRRVRAAIDGDLANACEALGADAEPLLALVIDDVALSKTFAIGAVSTWMRVDRDACLAHVLARADTCLPSVLWRALDGVDASEAFDVFAPRYRRDAAFRAHVSDAAPRQRASFPVLREERFVDLMIERLAAEPYTSCRLLGANGSPRAVAELRGVVERAGGVDDTLLAAFEGLELTNRQTELADLLVQFISAHAALPIAEGPLGLTIGRHAWRLLEHPSVLGNPSLRAIVERGRARLPMQVLG